MKWGYILFQVIFGLDLNACFFHSAPFCRQLLHLLPRSQPLISDSVKSSFQLGQLYGSCWVYGFFKTTPNSWWSSKQVHTKFRFQCLSSSWFIVPQLIFAYFVSATPWDTEKKDPWLPWFILVPCFSGERHYWGSGADGGGLRQNPGGTANMRKQGFTPAEIPCGFTPSMYHLGINMALEMATIKLGIRAVTVEIIQTEDSCSPLFPMLAGDFSNVPCGNLAWQ